MIIPQFRRGNGWIFSFYRMRKSTESKWEGTSHFRRMCVLPWPGLVITKLHSTRNFLLLTLVRLSVCLFPPFPMWWRPVLSGLSHISPVCLISLVLSLPMSFYQRIMRVCVSFHLVNADDSAPTQILISFAQLFFASWVGGTNISRTARTKRSLPRIKVYQS